MADWNDFSAYFRSRSLERNAFHLIPHIKPDSTIIDIGCGIGSITRDFARRVPHGSVVGIDNNEQSIATARAEAEKEGLTNVEFAVGDVEDLHKYKDNTFDLAHAHQVMLHLIHPVQSLKHMHRIIKPGGVVGIRDLALFEQIGATALMRENIERFWQDSIGRGARGPDAGRVNHLWMHEAGFKWENIKEDSTGFDHEREHLPAIGEGQISFAKLRNENDEYVANLRKDWEAWVEKPESRAMALDGWVVGIK